jgi:hypothetical protein
MECRRTTVDGLPSCSEGPAPLAYQARAKCCSFGASRDPRQSPRIAYCWINWVLWFGEDYDLWLSTSNMITILCVQRVNALYLLKLGDGTLFYGQKWLEMIPLVTNVGCFRNRCGSRY